MGKLHMVTFALLVIGGLNWGLWGAFNINLVMMIFGSWPMVERLVYVLVGLSAVYEAAIHPKTCTMCMEMMGKKK